VPTGRYEVEAESASGGPYRDFASSRPVALLPKDPARVLSLTRRRAVYAAWVLALTAALFLALVFGR